VKGGNTTNLLTHLADHHPDLYAKAWYGGKGKKVDFQQLLALHRSICVCVCVWYKCTIAEQSWLLQITTVHILPLKMWTN